MRLQGSATPVDVVSQPLAHETYNDRSRAMWAVAVPLTAETVAPLDLVALNGWLYSHFPVQNSEHLLVRVLASPVGFWDSAHM